MRKTFLILLLGLWPALAHPQSITTVAGAIKGGATLPTTCRPATSGSRADVFIKTGSSAGFYYCSAANTWTQVTGGGGAWGGITGTLSNQTDLQAALNAKANTSSLDNTIRSGLVAEYRFDEGSGQSTVNRVAQLAASANIFRSPEKYNTVWGSTPLVTDNYTSDPFGGNRAARFNASSGTSISQTVTVVAGTYTCSVYVLSNTGATQKMRMQVNSIYSADITIPATGWTRISTVTTYSSGGSVSVSPIVTDAAADPLDISFYGLQFELLDRTSGSSSGTPTTTGASPSVFQPNAAQLILSGSATWDGFGVNFNQTKFGLANTLGQYYPKVSWYMVAKWPAANTPVDSTHQFLLYEPNFYFFLANGTANRPGAHVPGRDVTAKLITAQNDGNWHLYSATYDGTRTTLWVDGAEAGFVVGSMNPFQATTVQVSGFGSLWFYPGTVAYLAIYNLGHTNTQIRAQYDAISQFMTARGITLNLTNYISFQGDSISADQGSSPTTYPFQLTYPTGVNALDRATNGYTLTDLTADTTNLDASARTGRSRNVLVVFIGHNDLVGATSASTFVANLKAYCLARRAAGWNKIVLASLLPSTAGGFNTKRNAANALIYGDTSFYDVLADFGADSIMGLDANASDTTWYSDGTHPTQAGQNRLATIAQAAVTAALL